MPNDLYQVKKLKPDSLKNPQSFFTTSVMDARVNIEGNTAKSTLIKDGDTFYFPDGNDLGIYNVFSIDGYNPALITKDHSQLPALGFMQTSRDWKNVEMTVYVKCSSTGQGKISLFCRGGKHFGSSNCEGFAYTANVYSDGLISLSKEQFHEVVFETDPITAAGSLEDQWFGIKFCVYNSDDRDINDKFVNLEIHLDINASNNWVQYLSLTDKGGWGNHAEYCGAVYPDQIGVWGGPVASFKWENFDNFRFKWMTVREIDPFIPFNEAGANATVLYGYGGLGNSGSGGVVRP